MKTVNIIPAIYLTYVLENYEEGMITHAFACKYTRFYVYYCGKNLAVFYVN